MNKLLLIFSFFTCAYALDIETPLPIISPDEGCENYDILHEKRIQTLKNFVILISDTLPNMVFTSREMVDRTVDSLVGYIFTEDIVYSIEGVGTFKGRDFVYYTMGTFHSNPAFHLYNVTNNVVDWKEQFGSLDKIRVINNNTYILPLVFLRRSRYSEITSPVYINVYVQYKNCDHLMYTAISETKNDTHLNDVDIYTENTYAIQSPLLQWFCTSQQLVCGTKQYTSIEECINVIKKKNVCAGTTLAMGDSLQCKSAHLMTAVFEPDTHCPHTGEFHEVCSHCDHYEPSVLENECVESCVDGALSWTEKELPDCDLVKNAGLCDVSISSIPDSMKPKKSSMFHLLDPNTQLNKFCPYSCGTCEKRCEHDTESSSTTLYVSIFFIYLMISLF